jgi:hypothetical protein
MTRAVELLVFQVDNKTRGEEERAEGVEEGCRKGKPCLTSESHPLRVVGLRQKRYPVILTRTA